MNEDKPNPCITREFEHGGHVVVEVGGALVDVRHNREVIPPGPTDTHRHREEREEEPSEEATPLGAEVLEGRVDQDD